MKFVLARGLPAKLAINGSRFKYEREGGQTVERDGRMEGMWRQDCGGVGPDSRQQRAMIGKIRAAEALGLALGCFQIDVAHAHDLDLSRLERGCMHIEDVRTDANDRKPWHA